MPIEVRIMSTPKHNLRADPFFSSRPLLHVAGKALVLAALLSGAALSTVQAGEFRNGTNASTTTCRPQPAPVSPTGGAPGGVVGS
jgi:hypothetical protein